MDDFTVEKALFKSFDVIIRRQLDPVWHCVSPKTKQLVGDLKTLRNLLGYLVSYDSVNFNLYLETILAAQNPNSGSYWIMTDPADKIYSVGERVICNERRDVLYPLMWFLDIYPDREITRLPSSGWIYRPR